MAFQTGNGRGLATVLQAVFPVVGSVIGFVVQLIYLVVGSRGLLAVEQNSEERVFRFFFSFLV